MTEPHTAVSDEARLAKKAASVRRRAARAAAAADKEHVETVMEKEEDHAGLVDTVQHIKAGRRQLESERAEDTAHVASVASARHSTDAESAYTADESADQASKEARRQARSPPAARAPSPKARAAGCDKHQGKKRECPREWLADRTWNGKHHAPIWCIKINRLFHR